MNTTKKLTSVLMSIIIVFSMSGCAKAYDFDFEYLDPATINAPSDWAVSEVEQANALGLVTSGTSNFFKKDINREQFAELVVNMVEKVTGKAIEASPVSTFTDTTNTDILKANNARIVNGVGDNLFAPAEYITREQIAAMIYRAIIYIENNKGQEYTTKNADISKFTDNSRVSDWAREAIGVLANNKIMNGTSDTTLSPSGSATIEQSVLLILRLYNIVK